MALPNLLPLTEAAAFTIGCAVMNARKLDPELVGVVLTILIAGLFFVLLIMATATGASEVAMPGLDGLHSVLE